MRHGHAISIDMAFTATLAMDRGMLSPGEHHRLLTLFSRAGLAIDHPLFDDTAIEKGTAAILKTRDGSLRLAVPSPLGACQFVNEFTIPDLQRVLALHKDLVGRLPRKGDGLEAFVDASDTGETVPVKANQMINGEKATATGAETVRNKVYVAEKLGASQDLLHGHINGFAQPVTVSSN